MPTLLQHCLCIVLVVVPLVCGAAASDTVTIGGAKLVIPPPAGFKNVMSNPASHWLAQSYASPYNDVLAFYVPDAMQIDKIQAGREIPRHMILLCSSHPAFQRRKSYQEFRNEQGMRQEMAQHGHVQVIRDAGNAFVTLAIRTEPQASVVVATTSLLVRERLLMLHVTSVLHSDADTQWVLETTRGWIDSINANNPQKRGRK